MRSQVISLISDGINYHGYTINTGNQRTKQTRLNNDYVDYTYDDAGQLKTALGKENGGSPQRVNEQLGYLYDAAGNLSGRTNMTGKGSVLSFDNCL